MQYKITWLVRIPLCAGLWNYALIVKV